MKLRYSVTSLAQTLHYIELARRRTVITHTLDELMLKLTEKQILRYIKV